MGMTITEKILARKSGKIKVMPGEFLNVQPDLLFANDATLNKIIKTFEEIGSDKVFDPQKVAFILDHAIPSKDIAVAEVCKRVRTFAQNSGDSLTEWKNTAADYGVLNLFMQYLVEHYGTKVLSDSFWSSKVGIPSLNEALKKNGYSDDFSKVFANWSIAVLVNDCSLGSQYCYLNQNLKSLKILPELNYLPLAGESTLQVSNYAKDWAGNWIKFIGGQGTLKLEFIGDSKINFEVPYVTQDSSSKYAINFLNLDDFQRGDIFIKNFGKNYNSLTIIPTIHNKLSGFDGIESFYKFIWQVSIANESSEDEELINSLLTKIELLKAEIARIQAKINAILGVANGCPRFESNLYYGIMNNQEVRCLQEFLKNQGTEIYPEGQITGNFLSLTQTAVIRFQEKYAAEILAPFGLEKGTGFVGSATRAKINSLSGK